MPLAQSRPNLALYMAGILILAMAAYGPIPQPGNYHDFADQRTLFGIPHAGDVLSNIGFLLVAAYGAWRMRGRFDPAQAVFFAALALTMLAAFAALSVWWWNATGDLRPYLLIQLAPLVLIPLLQWQTAAPMAQRRAFGLAIVLYVLAKLCEVGDQALFDALGFISGHTLKHLLATLAAFTLAGQFGGAR